MIKILKVNKKGTGWEAGLRKGDRIISINDDIINDQLDYKYYISEQFADLHILRDNSEFTIKVEKDTDDDLGITTESLRLKRCGNKCIFCFVDQNPDEMRKPIYIKDEDYRYSFLYGNYITLTNLTQNDIKRIIKQRLCPLYISVHSVNQNIRNFMLGAIEKENIIDKIKVLTDGGIELHGQIVLCPEINNGKFLKDTIFELFKYYPNFRSVSVVPAGLTKHREFLYPIKKLTSNYAKKMIGEIKEYQKKFRKHTNENFVYLGDEFFLKANISLPDDKYYDNFYQIENGVGLTRKFIDDFKNQEKKIPEQIKEKKNIYIITGALAYNTLEKEVISRLRKIKNLNVFLIKVENNFFGESVTVSGLLTGKDIREAIKNAEPDGLVLLPPNCVNEDGLFLDDWRLKDLIKYTSCEIEIYHKEIFNKLFNLNDS